MDAGASARNYAEDNMTMTLEQIKANATPGGEREFPVHEGELLAWDAGLYMSAAEDRIGFPRARAVLRQMLIHRPEQFQREKREMLTASFDRVFGHNARKAMALYESIESEGDMSKEQKLILVWEKPGEEFPLFWTGAYWSENEIEAVRFPPSVEAEQMKRFTGKLRQQIKCRRPYTEEA